MHRASGTNLESKVVVADVVADVVAVVVAVVVANGR